MTDAQWQSDTTYEPESLDDLLAKLLERDNQHLLYRGQSSFDWSLLPTLARSLRDYARAGGFDLALLESYVVDDRLDQLVRNVESPLLRAFMDEAERFGIRDLPPHDDRLAWWELMQHHGAPTRLLDWTRSPFVALWFAMQSDGLEHQDAAVWAFDSRLSWVNRAPLIATLEEESAKWANFLDSRAWQNRLAESVIEKRSPVVLVVNPRYSVPRVVAQQSVMTLIANIQSPTGVQDYVLRKLTTQIRIQAAWRPEILRLCDSLGLTRLDLFKDLDSLGNALAAAVNINDVPSIGDVVARTWVRNRETNPGPDGRSGG